MTGQILKIIFKQDRAYLTSDRFMTFKQLGMPDNIKFFKSAAYWTIKILNYKESEKKIFCEILSYHVGETNFGSNQEQLSGRLNDLQIITFRSIDTTGLLKTLYSKNPISYLPSKDISVDRSNEFIQVEPIKKQPINQIISETFFVPLKKVNFKLGGVSFEKKFKGFTNTLEITIANNTIREEFDAVKNYFANILETKKIQVAVIINITNKEITSIEAKSPEIDKIDDQLIDNVKYDFIKSTFKNKLNPEVDKSLFTMDEYFEMFSNEKIKSNIFYHNENEFFEDVLKISDTKHYKHLRFLSSKHSHEIMRLRFVLKPFSFIFLIEGVRDFHIVWETLDTEEATYVWHITKEIKVVKMTLLKIEHIINSIKVQGKIAYINSTEDPFIRIYHDYSDQIDGFIKWKSEIERILT